jgi:ABC-type dipeptide/oligopeptide/nickel transport system permease component
MRVALALLRLLSRAALAAAIVTLLSWTLVECAPGSSAQRAAVAARAIAPMDTQMPTEVRERILASVAEQHGLDEAFALRLGRHTANVLRLDFGNSWRDDIPVSDLLLSKTGLRSLALCLVALCLALVVGLAGAMASARRPASAVHSAWSIYVALILSVPIPWLAMLAIDSLAYGHPFSILPPGGLDGIGHALLPVLVLAAAPTAVVWRHAREEMLVHYASNWVLAARARGTESARLWRVFILRSALPPLLALVPALLAYLFAALVVVERVFAIEGVGDGIARAAAAGDAPVLVGAAALTAAIISLTSSGMDLLIRRLDPRREGEQ